jgi:hypothetical protein
MRKSGLVSAYLSSDFSADPTVVLSLPNFSTSSVATTHEATVSVSSPRILLTPGKLAELRQQASANTEQWQAFKQRLDQGLTKVLNSNQYQASSLAWIADYALGYQIMKESDPATAANYADKAIAMMKSGLRDYQQGWAPRQFLARGNGTTKTFTLANADILPSSVRVYVGPVTTETITRGNSAADSIAWYSHILKVSNTADGTPTYREGVDWWRNPMLRNNQLDWSLAGSEPAAGSGYYVTSAFPSSGSSKAFTLSGSTITLTVAPGTNEAVFVEYIYGTRSGNGSTLTYQQTGAGQGGFTSIYMDSNYPSRNLGKNIAIGYDWLQDYIGFSPALKAESSELLVKWNDYLRDSGFRTYNPANNYGAGTYVSRMMTAIALSGGRHSDGERIVEEMKAYREDWIIPLLQNPAKSHKGGFWSEGWAYGTGAARSVLLAGLAFEVSGLGQAAAERAWTSELTMHLITASPTFTTVYDGGDGGSPRSLPESNLFSLMTALDQNPTTRAYDNYILQNRTNANSEDFIDLMYRDTDAAANFWSQEPLHHRAEGAELFVARADWNYDSTWMAFQLGNLVSAFSPGPPGHLQLQRGADMILVNAPSYGNDYASARKSTHSNLVLIDDGGDGVQNYRHSMGVWFGEPGIVTTAYEAENNYVYIAGDYHSAYSHSSNPGGGGPVSELTRQVVYLRPDFVIVHDRATTIENTYLKQLQWHFINSPTVSGNSWVETVGSSKLFGHTFSSQPLTTSVQQITVGNKAMFQVASKNANPTASIRYITAMQSGDATVTSMIATQSIMSADGRMEGVQMGNELVLFGTDGAVDPSNPVTYTATGTGTVKHLLTDMQPGRSYQLRVNGANLGTVRASGQGTLSFSTVAGGTITLT